MSKPFCRSAFFNDYTLLGTVQGLQKAIDSLVVAQEEFNAPPYFKITTANEFELMNRCEICGQEVQEHTNRVILPNAGLAHKDCYMENNRFNKADEDRKEQLENK